MNQLTKSALPGAILLVFVSLLSAPLTLAEEKELNLEETIKASSEQPRVLYIVPWQQPGSPPELERSIGSEINQLFQLIDRSSFRRELKYVKYLHESDQRSADVGLFD